MTRYPIRREENLLYPPITYIPSSGATTDIPFTTESVVNIPATSKTQHLNLLTFLEHLIFSLLILTVNRIGISAIVTKIMLEENLRNDIGIGVGEVIRFVYPLENDPAVQQIPPISYGCYIPIQGGPG